MSDRKRTATYYEWHVRELDETGECVEIYANDENELTLAIRTLTGMENVQLELNRRVWDAVDGSLDDETYKNIDLTSPIESDLGEMPKRFTKMIERATWPSALDNGTKDFPWLHGKNTWLGYNANI